MPDFCRWHNCSIVLGILDDLADCFPDPLFQTLMGVSPSDGSFSGPEMLEFCEREGLLYAFGYSNHRGLKPQALDKFRI
jgi:hypothetical protein